MWFLGWNLKTYVKDRSVQPELLEIQSAEAQRRTLFDNIDNGGFQKLVVFNAGIGMFAGAYQIFAVGITLPMIEMVYYYPYKLSDGNETWLRIAFILGAIVGQASAGFLADVYGRRKLYGYELLVLLIATLGVSTASRGEADSMRIFAWLFAWRFLMGIGIGADYPLSATITAEFAPKKHRARMLASVFYAQPLGYLFAALVSIMTVASHSKSIPHDIVNRGCDQQCRRALDQSWRTIIGVGAIFAVIAIWFRRTIPEAPRYTADVLNRPDDAQEDVNSFMGSTSSTVTVTPLSLYDSENAITSGTAPGNRTEGASVTQSVPDEEMAQKFSVRAKANLTSFKHHFFSDRYIRVLIATSTAWFCVDTAYYSLVGASSTKIATKVFNTLPLDYNCTVVADSVPGYPMNCTNLDFNATNPYPQALWGSIFGNLWRVLILVCAGSIPAGACMIWLVQYCSLRRLQIIGFTGLAIVFIITGAVLRMAPAETVTGASVWLYIAAQVGFQIGPNFTTFMLPAELFPTRHRAFAHGISAACGKIGACIFVVFFQFARFSDGHVWHGVDEPGTRWLGSAILCFMPAMVLGAWVTWAWIPETRDDAGQSRRLEDLERLMVRVRGSGGGFEKLMVRLGLKDGSKP